MYKSRRVLRLISMNGGADIVAPRNNQKNTAASADYETFDTIAAYELDIDTEARDSSAKMVQQIFNKRERK